MENPVNHGIAEDHLVNASFSSPNKQNAITCPCEILNKQETTHTVEEVPVEDKVHVV